MTHFYVDLNGSLYFGGKCLEGLEDFPKQRSTDLSRTSNLSRVFETEIRRLKVLNDVR